MVDPTHDGIIELVMWIIGGISAVAALFIGIWWKVEGMQNGKIDKLHEENHSAHIHLHTKIDGVRDKVEDIWKHLVKRNGGKDL